MSNGTYQCIACGGTGDHETPCDCQREAERFSAMPRCRDCRHWEADHHPGNPDVEIRFCGLLSFSRGGWAALDCNKQSVYTNPEFGCTLWEAKEENS